MSDVSGRGLVEGKTGPGAASSEGDPRLVVPLAEVRHSDVTLVGSKAAVLGTLLADGFPVPDGLCVTTAAWDSALGTRREQLIEILGRHDLGDPSGAHTMAEAAAVLLADLTVPEMVAADLQAAIGNVVGEAMPLAVRSSATAEDLRETSFAGQYATVLGVRGEEALLEAIVTCWRSFVSASALVARGAAGAATGVEAMAVLVQPMVAAECAGVCMTVDPVRQRRDLIVVEAAWGLGLGAVDGTVATDTTWVHRRTLEVAESRVVEKPEQIALTSVGGVDRAPVPQERRRATCLPPAWAGRIAQFGVVAEQLLGTPQDLEWAIAEGRIWVLQSRHVTAISPELSTASAFPVRWHNVEDQRQAWLLEWDSRERVPPPLDHDCLEAFAGSVRDAAQAMGAASSPQRLIVNGRGYTTSVPSDMHAGDRHARHTALVALVARLRQRGLTLWDHWLPEIQAATARLRAFNRQGADGPALSAHLEDARGVFRYHWMLHWVLEEGFEPMWEPFRTALCAVVATAEESADTVWDTVGLQLLQGEETVSTRLADGLYALAQTARAEPALATLLTERSPDVLDRLAALPAATAFRGQLATFLEEFGDFVGAGFGSDADLHTPTWSEDPARVLAVVVPYLDLTAEPPALLRHRAQRERAARFEALCAACSDDEKVAALRRTWPFARRVATVEAEHNDYIDNRSVGQLRAAIMAAARWLVDCGTIATTEDIFILSRAEITAALQAETPASLRETVTSRHTQQQAWEALDPPPVLGTPDPHLAPRPPLRDEVTLDPTRETQQAQTSVVGQGASPGRRQGRARVVSATAMLPAVTPGDVLVAPFASPLWTPLFPILGGLVLDGGALFQHAMTAAREYGVPAVIGTREATRRIPDGAWVTIDGQAGTVEIHTSDA